MMPFRKSFTLVALVVLAACAPSQPAGPDADSAILTHIEGLGSLSFPNSGSEAAQEPFLRGVLLLHSFEYEPAAEAFRAAQEADPEFALAYWGEAMTYNHPLWSQQDREAAMEVLSRLGATPRERAERAGSDRERMYLEALEALYAEEGTKSERDREYMLAMRALSESYPEDDEARAFYALSILGTGDGVRDFATYMRAAATAQPVFRDNPDHPGAAHYIIHSFDDPVHAPLGLPAARAYSEIAPEAAHAQHMTSHIFVAMGMWQDVVDANTRARDVQDAQRAEAGEPPNVCGHYSSWLQYGHLMTGEQNEAEELIERCYAGVVEGEASPYYFALMRARQVLDTERWALAAGWEAELPDREGFAGTSPDFVYGFTNAFAALRAGDNEFARTFVRKYADTDSEHARVHVMQLEGLLALARGDEEAGVELLAAAAAAEDALPYEFGPPTIVKPSFELLGQELLALERYEEAEAAFRRAVERTPGRTIAVRGLELARIGAASTP